MEMKTYKYDEVLLEEGTTPTAWFFISKGNCRIVKKQKIVNLSSVFPLKHFRHFSFGLKDCTASNISYF